MLLKDALEGRLRKIEAEQAYQDQAVADLESLRLEAELMKLNFRRNQIQNTVPVTAELRDSTEIRRLEANLQQIKEHEVLTQSTTASEVEEQGLENWLAEEKNTQTKSGYRIQLLFNTYAPSEWSEEGGGGWRAATYGALYPTREKAEQRLRQLQAKFPNYPLKVVKK